MKEFLPGSRVIVALNGYDHCQTGIHEANNTVGLHLDADVEGPLGPGRYFIPWPSITWVELDPSQSPK